MAACVWQRVVIVFLLAPLCHSCAWIPVTDSERAILATQNVVLASGAADDHILGLHFVRTVSLLEGSKNVTTGSFQPLAEATNGNWKLTFLYSTDVATHDLESLRTHIGDIDSSFKSMTASLDSIFSNNAGRRFVVYLIPQDASFEGRWLSLAIRDQDVALRFAYRMPSDDPATLAGWGGRLLETLAHEYSHSYYWFHEAWFTSNFANEVVAYSVQKCIHVELLSTKVGTIDDAYDAFLSSVSGLSAADLYSRYSTTLPDSYLGNVTAELYFQRFLANLKRAPTVADLRLHCRAIVRTGAGLDLS